jgi:Lrp/AsnC family leucine-responsive transcriptional regulator
MIDGIDRKILKILQDDARTPNAEIARLVKLAPSAIFERVKKLQKEGILEGYHARLNPKVLDFGLLAFVFVRTEEKSGESSAGKLLSRIPEVQEVHHVAGEDCYLVKVRVKDTDSLYRLMKEKFAPIPQVRSTRTTIVLDTVKESFKLP